MSQDTNMASLFSVAKFFGVFLIFFCCMLSYIEIEAEAKGARFSGRFSGRSYRSYRSYRSTRTYRSYRSTSYSSTRSVSRWKTRGSTWKMAAAVAVIYGVSRYKSRSYYRRYPHHEPTICENHFDYKENGTTYKMFICPMYGQSDDAVYCCGSEDRQKCCRWQDDGGRVAGLILGLLAMIGITALVVYCCCCRRKASSGKVLQPTQAVPIKTFSHSTGQPPDGAYPPAGAPPMAYDHGGPGYAPQPYPSGPAGYPPAPADAGAPYPPAPGMYPPAGPGGYPPGPDVMPPPYPADAAPYPPGPAPYPPQPMGNAPYPPQPMGDAPYPPPAGGNYPMTAPPPYPPP